MTTIQPFLKQDRILMLALDHRGSLEKMLPQETPAAQKQQMMTDIKYALLTSLSSYYSGVLLDPPIGLPAYQRYAEVETSAKPYLLCIEKTGYTDTDHERLTELEYTVSELKNMGAKGVKLLLFYHPEAKTAKRQRALTKQVLTDCRNAGLPFFLEILNYSLDDKPYDPSVLVPHSVSEFLADGIDAEVFKLEYPGNAASCQKVTDLLGETPWILLTKGETYEKFVTGLKIAIANGAKGFLAGRAIWQDFRGLPTSRWQKFFETTVTERFAEICRIAYG
jgi:sulfofructosephosphate aldolase